MAARLDSVARYVCGKSGWRIANLKLQNIVYLAQMFYLGATGERLVDARFEAWDFGPIEPELYRKVRMYAAGPIPDVFYTAVPFTQADPRLASLVQVCDTLLTKRPDELVDITHWNKGAWAKNYVPGIRGVEIPDSDIIEEYQHRLTI